MAFEVSRTDPDEPQVAALLDQHFELMRSQYPEESCHVLPTDALKSPDISVFALREAGEVLAVGALKLTQAYAELKSMHTSAEARGRGAGAALVEVLMDTAREMGAAHVVRRQSFPASGCVLVTEALVRFLFQFRRQRIGAATGVF